MNEALRLLRVYHDMKAAELAAQLGISTSYLSEIENGKRAVSLKMLRRYCQVFDISPATLITFADALEQHGPEIKRVIGRKILEFVTASYKNG